MATVVKKPTIAAPRNYWFQVWKPGVTSADEAWVVQQLNKFQTGVKATEAELNAVLTWTFNNFDNISADVAKIIGLAGALGLGTNPTVAAAETAATAVLTAISAAKAMSATGDVSKIAATATSAYTAVKNLQVARIQASTTVATAGKQ